MKSQMAGATWGDLAAFVAVIDEGSQTAAARSLGRSPSIH